MNSVSANRVGLSVAAVLAGWHLVWVLLVASGTAQAVLDFAYKLHGLTSDAVVGGFDPGLSGLLLLATGGIGYVSGFGAAWVWNCLQWFQSREGATGPQAAASRQSTPRHAA